MKPSYYTSIYSLNKSSDEVLIYNTRTNALATLDVDHMDKYNQFLETGVLDDIEFQNALTKGGFAVEDNISEIDLLKTRLFESRYNNSALGLTIAGTADCNFRCVYCYEKESIKTSKMTKEIQDALIKFVEDQIKHLTLLAITWYGGEPLMAFDIIEYLSPKLIELCDKNDVDYRAAIVTNGYLLTPEKSQRLKELRVQSIQITLDGPQEIHDQRRPLVGGKGTFQQIVKNLSKCVDYFPSISIRVNTDSENFETVNSVRQTLADNGVLKDHVRVYLGYVENHNDAYELEKCLQIDQFSEVNLNYYKENNINIMDIYPRLFSNFCCADFRSAYIVDSEGYLYKCWNDVGIKENNVGHIKNFEEDGADFIAEAKPNNSRYMDYMLYDPTTDSECADCKCLPICMGGCPNKRLTTKGVAQRCINQKFILDKYIKECAHSLLSQQSVTQ